MHPSRVRSLLLVAIPLACLAACDAQPSTGPAPRGSATVSSSAPEPGAPLPGLTLAQRAVFERGRGVFQAEFTPETGLGPLFNNTACSQCHEDPAIGGIGEEVERQATAFRAPACDDLAPHGGPVIQDSVTPALHAALGIERESVPAAATDSAVRTTPSLLGFGLLEAVPDAEILALADPLDRNGDGISGRPNRTADGRLGRFGRKAQVAHAGCGPTSPELQRARIGSAARLTFGRRAAWSGDRAHQWAGGPLVGSVVSPHPLSPSPQLWRGGTRGGRGSTG